MRKITILLLSMLMIVNFAYAGGLVTNTNQSAAWSRMLVRDASTSIDAVYFNPAGLTKLADGFYISLSSQTIIQTQKLGITHQSFGLNNFNYTGNISAPVFPDLYIAYKTGKWAFSAGFNVIGGGGGAEFKTGVPMAELPIANTAYQLGSLGVSGYSMDAYLKGTSMYFGIQAGISYAITPNVSVYVGGRYNIAQNTYKGYLKNIEFNTTSGKVPASTFMNGVGDQATAGSQQASAGATSATAAATSLAPIISGGAGGYTLAQLEGAGYITATQQAQLEAGLLATGLTQAQVDALTASQAQGAFTNFAAYLTNYSAELLKQAAQMYAGAKLMADQNLDVKQKGTGFTPIIGANFSFLKDNLDIGIKYEFKTKMDLTNTVPTDSKTSFQEGFLMGFDNSGNPEYLYANGAKTNADIPSFLSVGVKVNPCKLISLQVGYHLYGDRGTDWTDVSNNIGHDYYELGLGAEFHVSQKVLLSAGYLHSQSGVNQGYQSDLNYSLSANTVGLGGAYKISDKVTLQLGGYVVSYVPETYNMKGSGYTYEETFKKSTWAVSAGLDFSLGKKHKK